MTIFIGQADSAKGRVSEKWIFDSSGCAVSVKYFDKSGRETGESKIKAPIGYRKPDNPCYSQ